MARDNEEIRRLADKFSGRSTKEVMEDPEFQQLTAEDVEALATEHGQPSSTSSASARPFSLVSRRRERSMMLSLR